MKEKVDVKKQWHSMLSHMLAEYRQGNPGDQRNDREVIESLMEHFVKEGIVKKENGKFILSELTHDA